MVYKKFFLVTVLGLVAMLVMVSCSANPAATQAATQALNTEPTMASPASETTAQINISGFAFDPPTLTVKEGTTVTWTNNDPTIHTVTSDTGVFDSGDLAQGATFSYTFTTAGTYAYHCTPHHARMSGTIIVTK